MGWGGVDFDVNFYGFSESMKNLTGHDILAFTTSFLVRSKPESTWQSLELGQDYEHLSGANVHNLELSLVEA